MLGMGKKLASYDVETVAVTPLTIIWQYHPWPEFQLAVHFQLRHGSVASPRNLNPRNFVLLWQKYLLRIVQNVQNFQWHSRFAFTIAIAYAHNDALFYHLCYVTLLMAIQLFHRNQYPYSSGVTSSMSPPRHSAATTSGEDTTARFMNRRPSAAPFNASRHIG